MLANNTLAPNQTDWDYKNDVTNEITGTGYTPGGTLISSPTITVTGNTIKLSGGNVSWTGATFVCRYAYVYDNSSSGLDSGRPLICYLDFGEDVSVTAGTFQITWASTGVATVTVA